MYYVYIPFQDCKKKEKRKFPDISRFFMTEGMYLKKNKTF